MEFSRENSEQGFSLQTFQQKNSIIDIWSGSKYASPGSFQN